MTNTILKYKPDNKMLNLIGNKQPTITMLKKVIIFITDKESVDASSEMVEYYKNIMTGLPTSGDNANYPELESSVKHINMQLNELTSLMEFIDSLLSKKHPCPTEIIIDDTNMQQALVNTKECIDILKYISDYINLALTAKKAKDEIAGNSKTYSFEELLKELKAA